MGYFLGKKTFPSSLDLQFKSGKPIRILMWSFGERAQFGLPEGCTIYGENSRDTLTAKYA